MSTLCIRRAAAAVLVVLLVGTGSALGTRLGKEDLPPKKTRSAEKPSPKKPVARKPVARRPKPQSVVVPSVVGMDGSAAKVVVTKQGLKATLAPPKRNAGWTVRSQTPKAGAKARPGSSVVLTLAPKPAPPSPRDESGHLLVTGPPNADLWLYVHPDQHRGLRSGKVRIRLSSGVHLVKLWLAAKQVGTDGWLSVEIHGGRETRLTYHIEGGSPDWGQLSKPAVAH